MKVSKWKGIYRAVVALTGTISPALGDTQGLYRFDTMADTSDDQGGQVLYDSSRNGFDFLKTSDGPLFLSSDDPAIAPAGAFALNTLVSSGLNTVVTNRFSIARTGQLSIEFWLKPESLTRKGAIVYYGAGASKNPWNISQTGAAISFVAKDNHGVLHTVTATLSSSDWTHIAATVDADGNALLYLNGTQQGAATGFVGFDPSYSASLYVGNGNVEPGKFLVDDLRLSDVTLRSGTGTAQGQLAWRTSLSQSPNSGNRTANFGKQWVRDNDFSISAFGYQLNTADASYTGAGLNGAYTANSQIGQSTLQKSLAANLRSHWNGTTASIENGAVGDRAKTDIQIAANMSNLVGFSLWDEPSHKQTVDIVKPMADYVRSIDPKRLVYGNLFPNYATTAQLWGDRDNPSYSYTQYIDDYVTLVKPDLLMYDNYPFLAGSTTAAADRYFSNLVVIRQKSLQHGIPFFSFIQSYHDKNNDGSDAGGYRLSSASELRYNLFTQLAAGAKGLGYFLYGRMDSGTQHVGLIKPGGSPSIMYRPAAQANAEVSKLGKSLRFLETTGLGFIRGATSGSPNAIPSGLTQWSAASDPDVHLQTIQIGSEGAQKNGLIGFFEDDGLNMYFMLVNLNHGSAMDPTAAELGFTLRFDQTINSIFRVNRETGLVEELMLTNHMLNLTLPGGTGDLFGYTSAFPVPDLAQPTVCDTWPD